MDVKNGKPLIVEVPVPACKKGTVVVKTLYSLVSAGTERMLLDFGKKGLIGKAKEKPDQVAKVIDKMKTDGMLNTLKMAFNKLDEPLPLGYSSVGEVIEVGSGIENISIGDLVACAGSTSGHSEVNLGLKNLMVKLEKDFRDPREAAFVALGAIAMQGIRQAEVKFGDWVAVIGLGLLGQLAARILKAAGCKVIGIDIDQSKAKLAETEAKNYLDAFVNSESDNASEEIKTITENGCDAVVITAATSSNQPVEFAAEISRDRGIISMVGVTGMDIPRGPFYNKELTFRLSRSYGPGRYDSRYENEGMDYPIGYVKWTEQRNMKEFIDMIHSGRITVSELITHEFDIESADKAYELITDNPNNEKYVGVLIKYDPQRTDLQNRVVYHKEFRKPSGKIGLGFIGAGNFVRATILPNITKIEDFELIGIATTTGTSIGQVVKKYPFKYSTTDYKKLLEDKDIDLIVVATPHNTHAKFTVEALDAGKHVYVEKPLAITMEQLDDIKAAYERNSQHVFVGFNRRYSPFAKFIKENMSTDKYPCIIQYTVNAGYIPKEHWTQDPEVGGGRIIGEACHFIDLAVFLTGSLPESVNTAAIIGNTDHYSNSDNVSINLTFKNGSVANIIYTAMGSKSFPKERVTVFCNGNVGEINNFVSATVYGSKKKRLRKLEQDKGFVEEYCSMSKTIHLGESGRSDISEDVETSLASFMAAGRPKS